MAGKKRLQPKLSKPGTKPARCAEQEGFTEIERFLNSAPRSEGMQGWFRRVSDRQLIENVLKLANARTIPELVEVWQTLGSRGAMATYSSDPDALPDIIRTFEDEKAGKIWRELFEEDFAEYRRTQKGLVPMLEKIQKGLSSARKDLELTIEEQLQGLAIITIPKFRAGKLLLEPRPYMPTVRAACAYAVALLLDPDKRAGNRTYGECLRCCAWGADEAVEEPCGRWFLSITMKGGGKPPVYCETHRLVAASSSAHRVRKHRAKPKAAKATRKLK